MELRAWEAREARPKVRTWLHSNVGFRSTAKAKLSERCSLLLPYFYNTVARKGRKDRPCLKPDTRPPLHFHTCKQASSSSLLCASLIWRLVWRLGWRLGWRLVWWWVERILSTSIFWIAIWERAIDVLMTTTQLAVFFIHPRSDNPLLLTCKSSVRSNCL